MLTMYQCLWYCACIHSCYTELVAPKATIIVDKGFYFFQSRADSVPEHSAENVWLFNFDFPPFLAHISNLLGEDDKYEEDEETLKGHHDGVDVGKK